VPDALLMLGIMEAEQKNSQKSQDYFNRVVRDYPNTVAAKKQPKNWHKPAPSRAMGNKLVARYRNFLLTAR